MCARARLLDEARPFLQFAFDEPAVLLGRTRHDFGADTRETLTGFGLRDAFDDRVVMRQLAHRKTVAHRRAETRARL